MKLPFEFGVKLIFRLVIPGFILSLGFLPLLNVVLKANGWISKAEYAFIILVILFGWIITISDVGIYMLLEGRRFWPKPIRTFCLHRERKRLRKVEKATKSADERIRLEAFFDIRNFRTTLDGDYEVIMPSRLGNLLYAFERYPRRTYGVDPVFYWPRIWLQLDKDVREEIDNIQALADSTAYTTFALLMAGILWLIYPVVKFLSVVLLWTNWLGARLNYDLVLIDQFLPRKATAVLIAVIFLLGSRIVYLSSLRLHAQYGEFFKSIFDLKIASLNVSTVIEELSRLGADCLNKNLDGKEKFVIAARYLQYYRYRCAACNALLKPGEIKGHRCDLPAEDMA